MYLGCTRSMHSAESSTFNNSYSQTHTFCKLVTKVSPVEKNTLITRFTVY